MKRRRGSTGLIAIVMGPVHAFAQAYGPAEVRIEAPAAHPTNVEGCAIFLAKYGYAPANGDTSFDTIHAGSKRVSVFANRTE